MAYRPPRRVAAYRGSGARRQPSNASRIAIARATSRRPKSGSAIGWIAASIALVLVVVTGTSIVGAGVGVDLTLQGMKAGLPDVKTFEDLQYAQSTKVFDRTG